MPPEHKKSGKQYFLVNESREWAKEGPRGISWDEVAAQCFCIINDYPEIDGEAEAVNRYLDIFFLIGNASEGTSKVRRQRQAVLMQERIKDLIKAGKKKTAIREFRQRFLNDKDGDKRRHNEKAFALLHVKVLAQKKGFLLPDCISNIDKSDIVRAIVQATHTGFFNVSRRESRSRKRLAQELTQEILALKSRVRILEQRLKLLRPSNGQIRGRRSRSAKSKPSGSKTSDSDGGGDGDPPRIEHSYLARGPPAFPRTHQHYQSTTN
jgi:hypothetical protein